MNGKKISCILHEIDIYLLICLFSQLAEETILSVRIMMDDNMMLYLTYARLCRSLAGKVDRCYTVEGSKIAPQRMLLRPSVLTDRAARNRDASPTRPCLCPHRRLLC